MQCQPFKASGQTPDAEASPDKRLAPPSYLTHSDGSADPEALTVSRPEKKHRVLPPWDLERGPGYDVVKFEAELDSQIDLAESVHFASNCGLVELSYHSIQTTLDYLF